MLTFNELPYITGAIKLKIAMIPSSILLSLAGAVLILKISKKIRACKLLEFYGQNTLVIYCLHFVTLHYMLMPFRSVFDGGDIMHSIIPYILLVIGIYGVCTLYAHLFQTRYLKFIMGK